MVVGFFRDVLMGPLVVTRLETGDGFISERVRIISKYKTVVVVLS